MSTHTPPALADTRAARFAPGRAVTSVTFVSTLLAVTLVWFALLTLAGGGRFPDAAHASAGVAAAAQEEAAEAGNGGKPEEPAEAVEEEAEAASEEKPAAEAEAVANPADATGEAESATAATAGAAVEVEAKAEAEAEAEEKEQEKEEKPKPPPTFRLHDGTVITGLPRITEVRVDTPYGELVVPRDDLIRIRFAREKDPTLEGRIRKEIERLESEEFEIREEATEALRKFGPEATKQLRTAAKSDDEEVKSRAEQLIEEIEEESLAADIPDDKSLVPIQGEDDEVVTIRFVIMGRVAEREFLIESNYGDLEVERSDIISVVFQDFSPTEAELTVPATHFANQNNWVESKLSVEKGQTFEITAGGTIHLLNYGWQVGPEGTTNIGGNHFENFPAGALVARVGTKGKAFLVGPSYRDKADASGKLRFAVAFRGGNVSGEFQVKIKVAEEDPE